MADSTTATTEDERATALSTFQTVTGVESATVAQRELSASQWNLARAVDHYMEHGPRPQAPPPRPPPSSRETRVVPHRQQRRGFWSWLAGLAWAPIGFVSQIAVQFWKVVSSLLGNPYQGIPGGWRGFKMFYEEKYGSVHPPFFEGTYWDATAKCQQDAKFLIVYLHSEAHELTKEFCENVMRDDGLATKLREGRFVFWAGSMGGRQGMALQRALRIPGFPYLAAIEASRMTVERREKGMQGTNVALGRRPLTGAGYGRLLSYKAASETLRGGPPMIVQWLDRIERSHGSKLDRILAERQDRENQRLLREEQDAAFREALEIDRAAAEEKKQKAEEEKKKISMEEAREARRKDKEAKLGQEPDKGSDVCALRLRRPDGSTVARRFKQDELLEKVFDWAEVIGVDLRVTALVCTYPRKQWRYPEDAETLLSDAGFFPSAILMLEERDDAEQMKKV